MNEDYVERIVPAAIQQLPIATIRSYRFVERSKRLPVFIDLEPVVRILSKAGLVEFCCFLCDAIEYCFQPVAFQ